MTPISTTEDGNKLNVNADMAAGSVAKALSADMCLFVTDVKGVLKNEQIIEKLTETETKDLITGWKYPWRNDSESQYSVVGVE